MKTWFAWVVPLRFTTQVRDHEGGYSTVVWWRWAERILSCKVHP